MPFKILNADSCGLPCDGRSFLRCGVIIISLIPSAEENACLANKYALLCCYKVEMPQIRRTGAFKTASCP